MKFIGHILIWTIFLSSIQLSQAMQSVHDMAFDGLEISCDMEKASDNCCSTNENDKEDNCCTGNDCECACCLHIVYINFSTEAFAQNYPVFTQTHNWEFNYRKEFLSGIFHPPLA